MRHTHHQEVRICRKMAAKSLCMLSVPMELLAEMVVRVSCFFNKTLEDKALRAPCSGKLPGVTQVSVPLPPGSGGGVARRLPGTDHGPAGTSPAMARKPVALLLAREVAEGVPVGLVGRVGIDGRVVGEVAGEYAVVLHLADVALFRGQLCMLPASRFHLDSAGSAGFAQFFRDRNPHAITIGGRHGFVYCCQTAV